VFILAGGFQMSGTIMTRVKNLLRSLNFFSGNKAVSAGAIILQEIDGELKIALAQHKNKRKPWVMPKGHIEAGESIEQAALREIYEETGLQRVQLIKYLGVVLRESGKSNGNIVNKTIHYYLAYALKSDQEKKPSDSSFTEPGWFSPTEAIQLIQHEEERLFFIKHLEALLQ
jgi:8-oxo-dGTP pyrophosphatase MutT (NUDIX family)